MTTKANVLLIAPELAALSNETFDLILNDVNGSLSIDLYGDQLELAERYYCAHLATLAMTGDGINPDLTVNTSETAGRVSISKQTIATAFKQATRYDVTKYGMMLQSLTRKKPNSVCVMVV